MGPTGLPEGPTKKWMLPFYAVKVLVVYAGALIGAAWEATVDAVKARVAVHEFQSTQQ